MLFLWEMKAIESEAPFLHSVNKPTLLLFTSEVMARVTGKPVLGASLAFLSRISSGAFIFANTARLCSNWWGVGGCSGGGQPPSLWAWLWDALLVIVPSALWLVACVCAVHCVFRLISVTLSPGDEAGQITLSAQPTHPSLEWGMWAAVGKNVSHCSVQSFFLFCTLTYL